MTRDFTNDFDDLANSSDDLLISSIDSMALLIALVQIGKSTKCISFCSGGSPLAFEISGIHEILRVPEIKYSALESSLCLGVITIRGKVIPVIDFARVIGLERLASDDDLDRRIIVLKIENNLFGLLVDSISSIQTFYRENLMPIPLMNRERVDMFLGSIQIDSLDIILLDCLRVLSNDEIRAITHGHGKVYPSEVMTQVSRRTSINEVYIYFRLDQIFAVSIGDVKEIIDFPKLLTTVPGMPAAVRGVFNLRGQLITIVDARMLYQMSPSTTNDPKVLIFQTSNEKFGLVVDSVESILKIGNDQKMALPSLMYEGAPGASEMDVREAVQVTAKDGTTFSLIVLNTAPIASRIRVSTA